MSSELSLVSLRSASADEWDKAWNGFAPATYFQSREWAEIWSETSFGMFTPAAELATFSDGRTAVLPLSRRRRLGGLAESVVSSIAETYGGWLSKSPLDLRHAALLSSALFDRSDSLVWKLNPFDPLAKAAFPPTGEPDWTHAVDVSVDFDVMRATWSRGHRASPAHARRAGVTVRHAESADDWRAFYSAYIESLRRWGDAALSRYDWSLFEALHLRSSPHVELWLSELEGQVVAGALCFYGHEHAVYWHGAAVESAFAARPVNLLFEEILRDACERPGVRWFDLNPSGPLAGVRAFKERFGAEAYACPTIRREAALVRVAHGSKRYAEEMLRRTRTALGMSAGAGH